MATKYHKPVARAASLAAALALTIPLAPLAASASKASAATTVHGTVVATNTARHTLLLAAGNAMDTVRFPSAGAVAKVALGTRMTVRASRLADGTFKALASRAQGRVDHTMIHGTVVSDVATNLVLSTGASTIAVDHARAVVTAAKAGRKSHATGSTIGVGTDVRVGVTVTRAGLDATSVTETGQSGFIGLEGTLVTLPSSSSNSSSTPASLEIQVEDGALTQVVIPPSITIPSTINTGDQVELLTSYATNVFTLVTITDDSIAATQSTDGVSMDQNGAGSIQGEGLVTALPSTSSSILTIQPGEGAAAMNFTVPTGYPMPVLQIGSRVHVTATVSGSTLTLATIQVQQSEGEGQGSMTTQTEGLVTAIPGNGSSTLTVQPGDGAASVSFVVPAGTDVSSIALGDRVHVTGFFDAANNNALTLQSFKVQQPEGDQGGQSGMVHIDGTVTAVTSGPNAATPALITIAPSDASAAPVQVEVLAALDPPTFAATYLNAKVTVSAQNQNGALTLVSIALND